MLKQKLDHDHDSEELSMPYNYEGYGHSYVKLSKERVIFLSENVTKEVAANLSAWFLKIVQKKMNKLNIKVSHVEFLETPKSKSTYYA